MLLQLFRFQKLAETFKNDFARMPHGSDARRARTVQCSVHTAAPAEANLRLNTAACNRHDGCLHVAGFSL